MPVWLLWICMYSLSTAASLCFCLSVYEAVALPGSEWILHHQGPPSHKEKAIPSYCLDPDTSSYVLLIVNYTEFYNIYCFFYYLCPSVSVVGVSHGKNRKGSCDVHWLWHRGQHPRGPVSGLESSNKAPSQISPPQNLSFFPQSTTWDSTKALTSSAVLY